MKKIIAIFSILFCFSLEVSTQNISLDTDFGTNGYQYGVSNGNYTSSSLLLPNGKILLAGTVNASNKFYISKFDSDGTPDTSFGTNGSGFITANSIANQKESIFGIAFQQDGKIIVAGQTDVNPSLSGYYYNALLARFHSDGTIDTSFGTNGYVKTELGSSEDFINDIYITNSGNIYVVAHSKNSTTGNDISLVLKYDSLGNLDTSFATNGIQNISLGNGVNLNKIHVQNDNSIIVAGSSIDGTGNKDFLLVKLLSNGDIDTLFGTNGFVLTDFGYSNEYISDFFVTDSKIVTTGTISSTSFLPHIGIACYNFDGSLDTDFSADGKVIESSDVSGYNTSFGKAINLTPEGKILVSGNAIGNNNYDVIFTTYNFDGSRYADFGINGQFLHQNNSLQEFCNGALIQSNGKIVVTGVMTSASNTSPRSMIIRFKDAYLLNRNSFEANDSKSVLYPNPVVETLHFKTNKEIENIYIYDLSGQLIKKIVPHNKKAVLDFLKSGIYFIEVRSLHKSSFFKIIKL